MVWYAWAIIAVYCFNAFAVTALIGRQKTHLTWRPVDAIQAWILLGLLSLAIVSLAT
jgi:hypothetical protein